MSDGVSLLDQAMNARRQELRLRWRDVAEAADVSEETIRIIRRDERKVRVRATRTEARIESALQWQKGSIQAIRAGGKPTPLCGAFSDGTPIRTADATSVQRADRSENSCPSLVADDPGYRAIWAIPDELLPEHERRYAIKQIEILRWLIFSGRSQM